MIYDERTLPRWREMSQYAHVTCLHIYISSQQRVKYTSINIPVGEKNSSWGRGHNMRYAAEIYRIYVYGNTIYNWRNINYNQFACRTCIWAIFPSFLFPFIFTTLLTIFYVHLYHPESILMNLHSTIYPWKHHIGCRPVIYILLFFYHPSYECLSCPEKKLLSGLSKIIFSLLCASVK